MWRPKGQQGSAHLLLEQPSDSNEPKSINIVSSKSKHTAQPAIVLPSRPQRTTKVAAYWLVSLLSASAYRWAIGLQKLLLP